MVRNRSRHISTENIDLWASSLGFSFPRNQGEEAIFDKLYNNYEHELNGLEIDPMKLLKELDDEETSHSNETWKMAARNYGDLPQEIIDKMKKNQDDKTRGRKED